MKTCYVKKWIASGLISVFIHGQENVDADCFWYQHIKWSADEHAIYRRDFNRQPCPSNCQGILWTKTVLLAFSCKSLSLWVCGSRPILVSLRSVMLASSFFLDFLFIFFSVVCQHCFVFVLVHGCRAPHLTVISTGRNRVGSCKVRF